VQAELGDWRVGPVEVGQAFPAWMWRLKALGRLPSGQLIYGAQAPIPSHLCFRCRVGASGQVEVSSRG
jgi:hypothetical protein